MSGFKSIVPDIGVLAGLDPVAIDAASLSLVEERAGAALSSLAYDIPYRKQLEYAAELGFVSQLLGKVLAELGTAADHTAVYDYAERKGGLKS